VIKKEKLVIILRFLKLIVIQRPSIISSQGIASLFQVMVSCVTWWKYEIVRDAIPWHRNFVTNKILS